MKVVPVDVTHAIHSARLGLDKGLRGMASRLQIPIRWARVSCIIGESAVYAGRAAAAQRSDGGWSHVEETIWCAALLARCGDEYATRVAQALAWLRSMQHADGGWGLSDRDSSRIPTTSLAVTLLPALANQEAIKWLAREWESDLKSEVKLTYKGGFFLMSMAVHRDLVPAPGLVERTIEYLATEQNADGGFGPWRDHPIGSDPWSTGITLVGLTAWPRAVDIGVIERAVAWLCDTQLDSGLWAYHFIDEGSAYAYWGLVRAVDYLERLAG